MQPDSSPTAVPAVEQERGAHSYRSFSWRGSWPTMRCVHCGCDSNSPASYQLCPGKPAKKTWGVNPIAQAQAAVDAVEPSEEKNLSENEGCFSDSPAPCVIAETQTDGAYACTRPSGHDGPCAAVPRSDETNHIVRALRDERRGGVRHSAVERAVLDLADRLDAVHPPAEAGMSENLDAMLNDARRAVTALYAQVPEAVAADVEARVSAALNACAFELKTLTAAHKEATDYATRLFQHLAPQCVPEPELMGVLTQIDNAIVGLTAAHETAVRENERLRAENALWVPRPSIAGGEATARSTPTSASHG